MNIKVLTTLLLMFSVNTEASIISPFINYNGGVNLAITGEIEDGDEEVLKSTIQDIRANNLNIEYIALDSKGGDSDTALNMSYAIKSIHANTIISDGAVCSNSCFFLFAAGDKKVITNRGRLGIKKLTPSIVSNSNNKKALLDINDVYSFYGVKKEFIDNVLLKTKDNKTYWLKKKDKLYFNSEKDIEGDKLSVFIPFKNNKASGFEYYLNAISYFSGINVTQSYKQGFEALEIAATENVPEALHKLGILYYKGIYVNKDSDKAEYYWDKSASLGYYPSLNNLTLTYEDSDAQEEIEVNVKITESNSASSDIKAYSAKMLGDAYYNGTNVEKSEIVALGYYKMSSELGDPEGQYKFSRMLIRDQKFKDAYLWLNSSCSVGFSDSCKYLKR